MKRLLLLASLCWPLLAAADGGAPTAKDYYDMCRPVAGYLGKSAAQVNLDDDWKLSGCLGFIDGLRVAEYYLKQTGSTDGFCAFGKTNEELAVDLVAGLAERPQMMPTRGAVAAFLIFKEKYPC